MGIRGKAAGKQKQSKDSLEVVFEISLSRLKQDLKIEIKDDFSEAIKCSEGKVTELTGNIQGVTKTASEAFDMCKNSKKDFFGGQEWNGLSFQ